MVNKPTIQSGLDRNPLDVSWLEFSTEYKRAHDFGMRLLVSARRESDMIKQMELILRAIKSMGFWLKRLNAKTEDMLEHELQTNDLFLEMTNMNKDFVEEFIDTVQSSPFWPEYKTWGDPEEFR